MNDFLLFGQDKTVCKSSAYHCYMSLTKRQTKPTIIEMRFETRFQKGGGRGMLYGFGTIIPDSWAWHTHKLCPIVWVLTEGTLNNLWDVAQWIERRNIQIRRPWVRIPWWGRMRDSFPIPPSQLLCRLICAWSFFVRVARTQNCVRVKDPISICRKE